jgi:hypothetical protein
MKPRYGTLAFPAVAMGLSLCIGCGEANEGTLKGESKVAPQREDMPNFKSYAEYQQYQMEQLKKAKNAPPKKAQ